mgnify:CR=1 FL=1
MLWSPLLVKTHNFSSSVFCSTRLSYKTGSKFFSLHKKSLKSVEKWTWKLKDDAAYSLKCLKWLKLWQRNKKKGKIEIEKDFWVRHLKKANRKYLWLQDPYLR